MRRINPEPLALWVGTLSVLGLLIIVIVEPDQETRGISAGTWVLGGGIGSLLGAALVLMWLAFGLIEGWRAWDAGLQWWGVRGNLIWIAWAGILMASLAIGWYLGNKIGVQAAGSFPQPGTIILTPRGPSVAQLPEVVTRDTFIGLLGCPAFVYGVWWLFGPVRYPSDHRKAMRSWLGRRLHRLARSVSEE